MRRNTRSASPPTAPGMEYVRLAGPAGDGDGATDGAGVTAADPGSKRWWMVWDSEGPWITSHGPMRLAATPRMRIGEQRRLRSRMATAPKGPGRNTIEGK